MSEKSNLNPFGPPNADEHAADRSNVSLLDRYGRTVIVSALVYQLVSISWFCLLGILNGEAVWSMLNSIFRSRALCLGILLIFSIGTLLSVFALLLTLRDLYFRTFDRSYEKTMWFFLILYTFGLGWLAYLFNYMLRQPRFGGIERKNPVHAVKEQHASAQHPSDR